MEILWIILGIIVFILVMGLLVMVHEAGHFWLQKRLVFYVMNFQLEWDHLFIKRKKVRHFIL